MFLLDEDKKILAKQVGAVQLAEILSQLEGLKETVPYFEPAEKKERRRRKLKKPIELSVRCVGFVGVKTTFAAHSLIQ